MPQRFVETWTTPFEPPQSRFGPALKSKVTIRFVNTGVALITDKPAEGVESGTALGYVYRYYPKTNSYVGTKDGKVWYLVPSIDDQIHELADLASLLAAAEAAGY